MPLSSPALPTFQVTRKKQSWVLSMSKVMPTFQVTGKKQSWALPGYSSPNQHIPNSKEGSEIEVLACWLASNATTRLLKKSDV